MSARMLSLREARGALAWARDHQFVGLLEVMVRPTNYGLTAPEWAPVDRVVQGDATPYPIRVTLSNGARGQFSHEDVLCVRVTEAGLAHPDTPSRFGATEGPGTLRNVDVDVAMLLYAFRYAMGRKSMAVAHVSRAMLDYHATLEPWAAQIVEEIDGALQRGRAGDREDADRWRQVRSAFWPLARAQHDAARAATARG